MKKGASKKKNAKKNAPATVMTPGRLLTFLAVMGMLPVLLVWHLANLQVIPQAEKGYEFLQKQGHARTVRDRLLRAYRGVITDRNGEILAVSTPVKSIIANPQKLDMSRFTELAAALGEHADGLAEKIKRYRNKQFVYLARSIPPHDANAVLSLNIDGVWGEEEFQRFYPAGEVAAHLVGFTNIDGSGQEGMELALDDWLTGEPGVQQVLIDKKGNAVKDLGIKKAASSGRDLQLSIDLRLQYLAYRELKNAMVEQGAKAGSVVILDVHSNEVLAMVNQPSYNPNNRSTLVPDQLRNRALTDVFEPGSTMKPFTVMAALETGRYTPNTQIDTSPGYWRVGGKTYSDFRNYGLMDVTTIIQKSSQVGVSKIAFDMEPETIRDMFYRVGFGQSSGTGFPGEAVGSLPSRMKWHPTEHAALAFGYGLSVNALQLAQAYSVFAAGGVLRPASLLKQEKVSKGVRIVDGKITSQMVEMLKAVTQKGGSATRAQIKGYLTAGKTGTAHKVGAQGYEDNKYTALFAGFAPADAPEIVTVVIVHEPPEERYYGGEAAAPVFARVAEGALRLLQVPPRNSLLAVN